MTLVPRTSFPLGVTAASLMTLGPDVALAAAQRADDLGYRSFWTAETTGPEAFSLLAAAGGAPPPRSTWAPACSPCSCAPRRSWPWPAPPCRRCSPSATSSSAIGISSPVVTPQVARRALRRPAAGPGARVRHARAAVPVAARRSTFEGDFYEVKRLPPRRPAGRAPAQGRGRRAEPRHAARWPARWPTACCSTTCRRRTCPGRSSRCARAADGPRRRPTVYAYVHAGVCERDDGIDLARARPVLLRRGRRLRPQLRAGRLRRRGRRHPRAPRRRRPGGRARRGLATAWSTPST